MAQSIEQSSGGIARLQFSASEDLSEALRLFENNSRPTRREVAAEEQRGGLRPVTLYSRQTIPAEMARDPSYIKKVTDLNDHIFFLKPQVLHTEVEDGDIEIEFDLVDNDIIQELLPDRFSNTTLYRRFRQERLMSERTIARVYSDLNFDIKNSPIRIHADVSPRAPDAFNVGEVGIYWRNTTNLIQLPTKR